MASTTFTDNSTVIVAAWLNDINQVRYDDTGASRVKFTPSGTNAVARNTQSKLQENHSVKDDGVTGDGITDDGANLRRSVDTFGILGGTLHLPQATYKTGASGGVVMAIPKPVSLIGDPGVYTAINPSLATSSDNTISIAPSTTADHTMRVFEKFSIHDPSTGNRTGNNGIFVDTQIASSNAAKFTLRDVIIGQGTGVGFFHLNTPANNVNGGLYTSLFQNNVIKGGMQFDSSGDSISIIHNTITGTGIGVNASLVAGASLLEIQANNITTNKGAIKIDAGSRFRIIGNNIENSSAGAAANNNSAIVNINGANGTMFSSVIKENLVSGFGTTDATTLIRLRNCVGTVVEDNTLLSGVAGVTTGIDVGSNCQDVRIGPNAYNAITTKVLDNGIGTMGVVKNFTLSNSWVTYDASTLTPGFIKSGDGLVHIWASIKNGTLTDGTLLATLPTGFRPSANVRCPAFAFNGTTRTMGEIIIESNGNITGYGLQTNEFSFNVTFPASSLANATSTE